ncbi:ammonium transporter [Neomegalonema sp.]|uniref:ammonium transporter n=1 Tax=Neomegalonema sp. TaxID=2039713 RepID=UPI002603C3E3|nr:ammonium transporter [Neomegalonema sp.]MDD2869850.1 ammonium transporter [Neomegalonema sp.]
MIHRSPSRWRPSGLAAAAAASAAGLLPGLARAQELSQEVSAEIAAAVAAALAAAQPAAEAAAEAAPVSGIDSGDTAFMAISTLLVLMMSIPGLALFYGGMVRSKNMLSVLTQVLATVCIACVVWVFWGYSMAFTDGGGLNDYVGGFDKLFLRGVDLASETGTMPEYMFVAFQMTFAAITPALALGSFAERMKFKAIVLFVPIWLTLVYFPMAHMVWGGGLLAQWGALDFAGGTVVHINAGVAGLIGALMVGPRLGFGKEHLAPHSLTMTMIGASLLWVGWFGFNAGSAAAANGVAALATVNTLVATAAAGLAWLFVEWTVKGHPSLLGLVSGVIGGLVAITPAAAFVGPMGAVALGLIAGPVCFVFCTTVKNRLKYDDSLDVFGVHFIGGVIGAVLTGVFMAPGLGGQGDESFSMGSQLYAQIEGVVFTILWSGVLSFLIFKLIDLVIGLRVDADKEREGLDLTEHGERAWNL